MEHFQPIGQINKLGHHAARGHRVRAFTLIELMVSLAILFLMLTVLLVPLRLAFDSLNIGRARSETQLAAQVSVNQIEEDIRKAVFVFPNTQLAGVTDKAPYVESAPGIGNKGKPYIRRTSGASETILQTPAGQCDKYPTGSATAAPWDNPSRLDLILPHTTKGVVDNPVRPGNVLVTYYPRRVNMNAPFDPIDNPIVLFRAQIPFRNSKGELMYEDDTKNASDPLNADLSNGRLASEMACGTGSAKLNRNALWLSHNKYGEAQLDKLVDTPASPSTGTPTPPTVFATQALATPRGMALEASHALDDVPATKSYVPDSSFVCEDTNKDGKIDRVTIKMILTNYAASNSVSNDGTPHRQIATLTRTVDLPNVR